MKTLLKILNKPLLCLLIVKVGLFAACSSEKRPVVQLDPADKNSGIVTLNLTASTMQRESEGLKSMITRTIRPTDEDLKIASFDIVFKHNQYPYPDVEINDIDGSTTWTDPIILAAGSWTALVYAKNNTGQNIGLGNSEIVINPGRTSEGHVIINNVAGQTPLLFSIDLGSNNLDNPLVIGTVYGKNSQGETVTPVTLTFSINENKTAAFYQGSVPAGFYELEIKLLDNGIPHASYHDTLALYSGILIEQNFILNTIPGGGSSIAISDKIKRPLEITFYQGDTYDYNKQIFSQDEMTLDTSGDTDINLVIDIRSNNGSAVNYDKLEWRLNNTILENVNANGIVIQPHEIIISRYGLLAGVHQLEAVVWQDGIVSSEKVFFTVNPTALSVDIQGLPEEIYSCDTAKVSAATSLEADSYEWYINGRQINGENKKDFVLKGNQNVVPGENILEARARKGTVVRSATHTFLVKQLSVAVNLPTYSPVEGQSIIATAVPNTDIDTYQWYLNNKIIAGENQPQITFGNNLQVGEHTLAVKATSGEVESVNTVTFTVVPLTINFVNCEGTVWQGKPVNIVASTNAPLVSYQWYINNKIIEGADSAYLTIEEGLNEGTQVISVSVQSGSITRSQSINLTVVVPFASISSCEHTLGVKANGTLWVWGNNGYGQLGNGTRNSSSTPIKLQSINGVSAASAGGHHSLALKADGTVWAWGYNTFGQLGNFSWTNYYTPIQVDALTDVVAIAAGSEHSLALKTDGTVWAWGYNYNGQLGNGTLTDRNYPVQVSALTDVIAIAAGHFYSLALKSDGTVWAWGHNSYGQLGNGTTTSSKLPVQVNGLTGIIMIRAGYSHSLALKSDGTVWAWGYNHIGQLGNGTTTSSKLPVQVNGLTDIIMIGVGSSHSLALKSDGTIQAWGDNSYGQLGDETWTDRYTPVQVKNLSGTIMVTSGSDCSMALKSDGEVWGWGANLYGVLGNGSTNNTNVPVMVP